MAAPLPGVEEAPPITATTAHQKPPNIAATTTSNAGMGYPNRYTYEARATLLDYLGHMNNAAFLTHAELARWEMLAYNGVLGHMLRHRTNLVVASTAVRYRQEIRPLYVKFQVETFFGGIDDRTVWAMHNFRIGPSGRIRAQLVVPCVFVKGSQVQNPQLVLRDAGMDDETMDALRLPIENDSLGMNDLIQRYSSLEEWMRQYASKDEKSDF